MRNPNKVAGQVMSTVIKRIKSSDLPKEMKEKVIAVAKGDGEVENQEVKLSSRIRKVLFSLVVNSGPMVITGKKKLKVYTMKGYRALVSSTKKNRPCDKKYRAEVPAAA